MEVNLKRVNTQPMRTYGQFCGIAKALDVVGDRWTLLIVRELLARGPCRYSDLRNGLPGIATNLLASRLKELEAADIILREAAHPPVASHLFVLTERGRELEGVLRELGRWGMPMLEEPGQDDVFQAHWLALPAKALSDRAPDKPPAVVQLRAEGMTSLVIEMVGGTIHVQTGRVDHPSASMAGPPELLTSVLAGTIALETAQRRGLHVTGDLSAVERMLPLDDDEKRG